jgi:hypothetical protein
LAGFISPNPYTGNVSAGDVRALADLMKFHLRSTFEIGTILMLIDTASFDGFDTLIRRLELGIPESLMDLTDCQVALTRGEMMALQKSGINNLEIIRQESLCDTVYAPTSWEVGVAVVEQAGEAY